jgi:uncharacterized protein (TIGR03000 family)
MYSVILMAALTANTAEAPTFFKKGGCGCTGGMVLHGSCYGCYGSCAGCYGCSGCWGSCYGCSGCWGSCYGCSGCWGSYSYGCCGYSSGCYGCMGCYGVYNGGWGGYDGMMMGGAAPAGNPMQTPAAGTAPAAGTTPPAGGTTPPAGTTPPPAGGTTPKPGTSAKLIIEKPVDAKIFVDERLVKSEGTRQTFSTPVLDPNQAYFYTVRVETTRDGKPASETRRVIVRSGETIQESFNDAGISTASAK